MLVLDSFRGHIIDRVKKTVANAGCDLVIIPGGMTSILQPLDVVLNKPFKDRVGVLYRLAEPGRQPEDTNGAHEACISQHRGTVVERCVVWTACQHGPRRIFKVLHLCAASPGRPQ
ncbi:POGO family transposase, putative [Ixodes scapularis]|uniref:POGO family transposase, putative n=1 Tax=Ixodes scapularis TaxID=6945 RepID=B7QK56_IXOSC|nr:POGO family transposase, putative [Ixodes scapularis]|eukprot:XP_002415563.1 POGO family transposase, putative [Ixodes scapularis]